MTKEIREVFASAAFEGYDVPVYTVIRTVEVTDASVTQEGK